MKSTVAVGAHVTVVVEALVEIDLTVAVEIVKLRNLVPTDQVSDVLDDLHSKRMVKPCRNALPRDPRKTGVDALHQEDVALHGADRQIAV